MKITKRPPAVSGDKSVSGMQGARVGKLGKPAAAGKAGDLQAGACAVQLRELEAELARLDISDTARIAAIKHALDNGSYEVNSVLVADRLIDTTREAVRKRPRKWLNWALKR